MVIIWGKEEMANNIILLHACAWVAGETASSYKFVLEFAEQGFPVMYVPKPSL